MPLRLLVLVAGRLDRGLQVTASFCNLGLRFEGLFWERYIFEGPNCVWWATKTSILNTDYTKADWKVASAKQGARYLMQPCGTKSLEVAQAAFSSKHNGAWHTSLDLSIGTLTDGLVFCNFFGTKVLVTGGVKLWSIGGVYIWDTWCFVQTEFQTMF